MGRVKDVPWLLLVLMIMLNTMRTDMTNVTADATAFAC